MSARGPKLCPKCHLLSPAAAQRCDCGYDFSESVLTKVRLGGKSTGATISYRPERKADLKTLIPYLIKGGVWGASAALLTATLQLLNGPEGANGWQVALLLPLLFGGLMAVIFATYAWVRLAIARKGSK